MPYGYIDDGAAHEAVPGVPFTTPKLKIQSEEDEKILGAPLGAIIDHPTQHAPGFLAAASQAELDRYLIQTFDEPDPPAGQVVTSREIVLQAGVISISATFEPAPIPDAAAREQMWAVLQATPSAKNEAKSLFDDMAAAVFKDPSLSAWFTGSVTYQRAHPMFEKAAELAGLTDAQVDQLFIAAQTA